MTVQVTLHGPRAADLFGAYAEAFARCFGRGERCAPPPLAGVCGRVLRGVREEDFCALSDDPARKVVFMLDAQALGDLLGRTGSDLLTQIGYAPGEVRALMAQGVRFKLVIVPQVAMARATWDTLLDLVAACYPEWEERIATARATLKALPYAQVMAGGGEAAKVRRFLEEALHVSPLFAGDGFTRCGGRAVYAEYACCNYPLSDFADWCLIEFPVMV